MRHHPDHNPSRGSGDHENRDNDDVQDREVFLRLSEAHRVLTDDKSRAAYDRGRLDGNRRDSYRSDSNQSSRDSRADRGSQGARERSILSNWFNYRTDSKKPFREWRVGPNPREVRSASFGGGLAGLSLGALFGALFLGVAGMNWAAAIMGAAAGAAGAVLGTALGAAFHAFGFRAGYTAAALLGGLGSMTTAGILLVFTDPYPRVVLNGLVRMGEGDPGIAFIYCLLISSSLAGGLVAAYFSRRAYHS